MKLTGTFICVVLLCMLSAMLVHAQDMIIYPAKGQSAQQMDKDKAECQAWAKKETGVDPLVLAEKSAQQPAPSGPRGRYGGRRGKAEEHGESRAAGSAAATSCYEGKPG